MMKPTLGVQELELLRFISGFQRSLSVRDVVDLYGEPRGLARTTVLTMMERLRKKGFLTRAGIAGINHYSAKASKGEFLQEMVRNFVENTLEGSLSPFVSYLMREAKLSDEELAELKQLIGNLDRSDTKREGKSDD